MKLIEHRSRHSLTDWIWAASTACMAGVRPRYTAAEPAPGQPARASWWIKTNRISRGQRTLTHCSVRRWHHRARLASRMFTYRTPVTYAVGTVCMQRTALCTHDRSSSTLCMILCACTVHVGYCACNCSVCHWNNVISPLNFWAQHHPSTWSWRELKPWASRLASIIWLAKKNTYTRLSFW